MLQNTEGLYFNAQFPTHTFFIRLYIIENERVKALIILN